jgi:uncharacterized protein (DUF362 family)
MHRNQANQSHPLSSAFSRTSCFVFLLAATLTSSGPAAAQSLRPDESAPASKPAASAQEPASRSIKPGFVLVHAPNTVSRFKANPKNVTAAFNAGFLKWSGQATISKAWQTLVQPGEKIGLRINTTGGHITSTHPSLVQAIVDGLVEAGISATDIIVWDKNPHHMIAAGYVPMKPDNQWQCLSTVEGSGWDPKVFYFQETVGRLIWGDYEFKGSALPDIQEASDTTAAEPEKLPDTQDQISNRSYFSKILTQEVDKVINIPSMTSHQGLGLLGCLSSMAVGSIDNHRRFLDGSNASATAIAEILQKEPIANKVILHVMDGLIMQYAGGPAFDPHYADSRGFILIGQDPVAIDSWVVQQMEYRREDTSVVPIGSKADHIKAAQAFGLGQHFEESVITEVKIP